MEALPMMETIDPVVPAVTPTTSTAAAAPLWADVTSALTRIVAVRTPFINPSHGNVATEALTSTITSSTSELVGWYDADPGSLHVNSVGEELEFVKAPTVHATLMGPPNTFENP